MPPPRPAADVVQKLLAEVRQLKVDNQMLRDEVAELRDKAGKPDPRLKSQEVEIERLRTELARAREQRDVITDGVRVVIDQLRAKLPTNG